MTTLAVERVKQILKEMKEEEDAQEKAKSNIRLLLGALPDTNVVLKAKSAGRILLLIKRADGKVDLIDTAVLSGQKMRELMFKDIDALLECLTTYIVDIDNFFNKDAKVMGLEVHVLDFTVQENFKKLLEG